MTDTQERIAKEQKSLAMLASFVGSLAELSKCQDRKVSCIVCDKTLKQIYSMGVNGGPAGSKDLNCLCVEHGTKYSCIHAEINALIKLQVPTSNKIMICSLQPCTQCAAAIVNEPGGFDAVLFLYPWKETLAEQILKNAGINLGHLGFDGSVTWR